MDTIKCECGEEILLLPDVRAMGEAIEIHVAMHMQRSKALADPDGEAERLRDDLIAQVFNLFLSKTNQSENDGAFEKGSNLKLKRNEEKTKRYREN
jgi:hypothetical protein